MNIETYKLIVKHRYNTKSALVTLGITNDQLKSAYNIAKDKYYKNRTWYNLDVYMNIYTFI